MKKLIIFIILLSGCGPIESDKPIELGLYSVSVGSHNSCTNAYSTFSSNLQRWILIQESDTAWKIWFTDNPAMITDPEDRDLLSLECVAEGTEWNCKEDDMVNAMYCYYPMSTKIILHSSTDGFYGTMEIYEQLTLCAGFGNSDCTDFSELNGAIIK